MDQITLNKGEKFDTYMLALYKADKNDVHEIECLLVGLEKNIVDFEDLAIAVNALAEHKISQKMQKDLADKLAKKVGLAKKRSFMHWCLMIDGLRVDSSPGLEQLRLAIFEKMLKTGTEPQLKVLEFGMKQTAMETFIEPMYFTMLEDKLKSF